MRGGGGLAARAAPQREPAGSGSTIAALIAAPRPALHSGQQQQGAGPRDVGLGLIEDQPIELLFRIGGAAPSGINAVA